MKLKKLIAVVLALVLVFSLCSCGKMTAEKLIADMAKALVGVDSFSGSMNTGMEMNMSLFGESLDMSTTLDAEVSFAGNVSYTSGTTTLALSGEEMSEETEVYTVTEGDSITTYTKLGEKWVKSEMQKPKTETRLDTVLELISPDNLGNIVLQEELDTYNGKEVYVLTIADCNYPELVMDTAFSQFGDTFSGIDLSEIDLSGVVMQVTIKVYKDTKLPAVIVVDFGDSLTAVMEEMTDVLTDAMTSGMGEFEKALLGQIEIKLEIPGAISTVTFDEYNIAPIVVPEEALNADEIFSDGTGIFGNLLGTGSAAEVYDVKVYVQGMLDAAYLNNASYEFMNMVMVTREEVTQYYESCLEMEAEYFASFFDIILDIAPEGTFERIVQLYRQIYPYSKYDVGKATVTEDGYIVDVTVYPIDIIRRIDNEAWESFSADWRSMSEQLESMTKEEIEELWSGLVIDLIESYIPKIGYLDPVTISVHVEIDEYGYYYMNDEDFGEIDNYIIAY